MRSSINTLLFRYLSPIRTYGKEDVKIILKLLESLKTLIYLDRSGEKYLPDLLNHVMAVRDDADNTIQNLEDRHTINLMLEELAACVPGESLKDKIKMLSADTNKN